MAMTRHLARVLPVRRVGTHWSPGYRQKSSLALSEVSWTGIGVPEHMLGKLPKLGVDHPTPVQAEAVPLLIKGQSTVITAPTGTGKTLSYAIPLAARVLELHAQAKKLGASKVCRALVVVPTRELARQVQSVLDSLLAPPARKLKKGAVGPSLRRLVGEISHARLATLATDPPAVVVGTPQTLASLIPQRLSLQGCACLVLDEADSLLSESSFRHTMAILKAASRLKVRPWTAMVTATVTPAVDTAARKYMRLKKGELTLGAIRSGRPDPLDPEAQSASETGTALSTGGVQTVDLSRSEGRYSLAPGVVHTGVFLRQPGAEPVSQPAEHGAGDEGDAWKEPVSVQRARAAGLLLSGRVAVPAPGDRAGKAKQRVRVPGLVFASSGATARAAHAALMAGASTLPFSLSASDLLRGSEADAASSGTAVSTLHSKRYARVLQQTEQAGLDAEAAAAAWALRSAGRNQLRASARNETRSKGGEADGDGASPISVLLKRAATAPTTPAPAGGRSSRVVAALRSAEQAGLSSPLAEGGDLRRVGQPGMLHAAKDDKMAPGLGWELILQGTVNRDRARALKRLLSGQAAAALTTDHLARGVDLPGLKTVLCLSPSPDAVTYLHRAGRVGRVRSRLQAMAGTRIAAESGGNPGATGPGKEGRRRGRPDDAELIDADLQPLVRDGGDKAAVGAFAFGRVLTLLASEAEVKRYKKLLAGFAYPSAARDAGMGVSVAARAEIAELQPVERLGGKPSLKEAWELRPLEQFDASSSEWVSVTKEDRV